MKQFKRIVKNNNISISNRVFSCVNYKLDSSVNKYKIIRSVAHEYCHDCSFTKFVYLNMMWYHKEPYYVIYSNKEPDDECSL